MKKVSLVVLLTTLTVFLSFKNAFAEDKKDVFSMSGLILYQEDQVMRDRIASNISLLADYSLILEARAKEVFKNAEPQDGVSGVIVVTIKPGNQSRMWLALENDTLPETLKQNVLQELSSVKTIPVKKGPIMFGLRFDAWGGGKPLEESHPIPQEWKDVIKDNNPVIIPDTPLAVLWPDEQIVADEFLGIWEGDLSIIHAPDHEDFANTMTHRFEFTKEEISISQKYNDKWLYFNSKSEISFKTNDHIFMHNIYDSGQYIQIYSINLIRLNEETVYAYVSRVVENYTLENDEKFRHFPIFAEGVVTKK